MRSIDADALKEEVKKVEDYESAYTICAYIDNAPTVEPERPQGKWIPVSERLPEENGRCLVTTDFGDVCMDSFIDGIFVLYLGNVIAWQPLPEPYKEGGAE